MSEVLCKDCKHSKAAWGVRFFKMSYGFKCTLPGNYREPKWDPVVGETEPGYFFSCHVARGSENICGRDAKNWEPRHKKHFLTYLKRI